MNVTISRDGVELGVWTQAEVQYYYKTGKLLSTDYYWFEGMAAWEPLARMLKSPSSPPIPPPAIPVVGISRKVYGLACLGIFVGAVLICTFLQLLGATGDAIGVLMIILIDGPFIGLTGYRMLNIGYPGWYCVFCILPLVNIIIFLIGIFAPTGYAKMERARKMGLP